MSASFSEGIKANHACNCTILTPCVSALAKSFRQYGQSTRAEVRILKRNQWRPTSSAGCSLQSQSRKGVCRTRLWDPQNGVPWVSPSRKLTMVLSQQTDAYKWAWLTTSRSRGPQAFSLLVHFGQPMLGRFLFSSHTQIPNSWACFAHQRSARLAYPFWREAVECLCVYLGWLRHPHPWVGYSWKKRGPTAPQYCVHT